MKITHSCAVRFVMYKNIKRTSLNCNRLPKPLHRNIAINGTGNVGGALAIGRAKAGHTLHLGVPDIHEFKVKDLLNNPNTQIFSFGEAVAMSEVVLIATPPTAIFSMMGHMGYALGKTLLDATNSERQTPDPYKTVYHALVDKTKGDAVKCFNSTGFENMLNPIYNGEGIDMFRAGDSDAAKQVVLRLAFDNGFASCMDFGKADKVELLKNSRCRGLTSPSCKGMVETSRSNCYDDSAELRR
jgi:predicted dinucleotide-binding enzyme